MNKKDYEEERNKNKVEEKCGIKKIVDTLK